MQKLWKSLLILLSLTGILVIVAFDYYDRPDRGQKNLYFTVNNETIMAWEKEDIYYLFLPSGADTENIELSGYSDGFTVTNTGNYIKSGTTLKGLPIEKEIPCIFGKNGNPFVLFILKSKEIPAMFISTDSGTLDDILNDKEYKESGAVSVQNEDGTYSYTGGLKYIKGRGNYSWNNYEKKPFSISLKEEESLLGLPKGKNYVLVSNASDPTLLRNDIVRGMEEELDILYTGKGRFLDLYVNGEYLGNYYLCEKVEIGETRINITDLEEQMDYIYRKCDYDSFENYITEDRKGKILDVIPADVTGGYLVEREFIERYQMEYEENPSSFVTSNLEHFLIKSPVYCSSEQIDYISTYFNEAEGAILSPDNCNPITGKNYSEYIDMESFVKKYLVEEVSKNYDAGVSSSFFYKDCDSIDGKIYAGPGWDYDMTLGNYLEWMAYFSANPEGISKLSVHDFSTGWFDTLYEKEDFNKLIIKHYREQVRPYLKDLLDGDLQKSWNTLTASSDMDYIRWQQQYIDNPFYESREESFQTLYEYIQKRMKFLDSVWMQNKEFHIVKFMKNEAVLEVRYIEDGEALGTLPTDDSTGRNDWYEDGSGEAADSNKIIRKETIYRAK